MEKHNMFRPLAIYFLLLFIVGFADLSIASPSYINLQSRISKPEGSGYLESNNVQFRMTITDPLGTCILFQEDFANIDMTGSKGLINFKVGTGSKTYPAGPMAMPALFTNFNSPLFNCQAGGTYTAASTDSRKLVMQFNDGSGWQTVPAMEINSVPYSLESLAAQKLGSYPAADYVRSAQFTSCTGSEAVHFNGTNFTCVPLSSGASYSAITGAAATNTIDNTNYAQTWNWSTATTQNPMTMAANALTTGSLLNLTTSNNSLNSTNGILNVANTGASTNGLVARIQSNSTAGSGLTVLANGNVGIGTTTPAAKLEVVGEIKVGNSGTACTATTAGAFRWNASTPGPEVCDGTNWRVIPIASASGGCTGPSAFSFTNVTNAPMNMVTTSNSITPTGCSATMSVSITGSGNPQLSVNNGPWTTSTTLDPGQSLRLRLTSSGSISTANSAVVVIGSTTGTTWSVTTKASNTRIFATSSTFNGAMGGLVAADNLCQTAAAGLAYGGFWKALLSDSVVSAKNRLQLTYPVVRATDSVVVASLNLWVGSVAAAIVPAGGSRVWTGTYTDGNKATSHCNDWTSASSAHYAVIAYEQMSGLDWVATPVAGSCNSIFKIYCVEQPDPGCSANAFSFTNVSGATLNTVYTSDTITPAGCATSSEVFVDGPNNPQVSINGGAWTTRGTLNTGDTLTARQTTSGKYSFAHKARIYIGSTETTWTVSTQAGGTQIFATANAYNGNIGGVSGADSICQNEATTLGYGGTWKAIISSSTVNAKDRVSLTYPIVSASDGTVIAPISLWSGSVAAAFGGTSSRVWTGSASDGNNSGAGNCTDWTSASSGQSATYGWDHLTNVQWISESLQPCSNAFKLYCVSQ